MRICPQCKKRFTGTIKYCSGRCSVAASRARKKQEKPPQSKICPNCNNQFTPNTARQTYCGNTCKSKFHYKGRPKSVFTGKCRYCGEDFEASRSTKKYCDSECRALWWWDKLTPEQQEDSDYQNLFAMYRQADDYDYRAAMAFRRELARLRREGRSG